ncbi:MAG: hypothetical protein NT075_17620 [Chloroflexi bacterium]|nr:hypothetical protein [Chloroflexota bacterium]
MQAYEFSTTISNAGQVFVPSQVADKLPEGASVRVLILVDEVEPSVNGHDDQSETLSFLPSLEELVAEIKRSPTKPANFRPGSGLLAEHLANPVTEPDPNFDEIAWNQEWDRIEAEMKAEEFAHEQEELKELFPEHSYKQSIGKRRH